MKNFDVFFFFFLKFNFFRFPRTEPILLDVNESPDHLDDLIKSHNVVVSLLPWTMHPVVAKRCIANKTDMVSLKNNFDFLNSLRSLFLRSLPRIVPNKCKHWTKAPKKLESPWSMR